MTLSPPQLSQVQIDNFFILVCGLYGDLADKYVDYSRQGDEDADCLLNKMILADSLLDTIQCYSLTNPNACYTYNQLIQVMQTIMELVELRMSLWKLPQTSISGMAPGTFIC